jgi:hypothetical protein
LELFSLEEKAAPVAGAAFSFLYAVISTEHKGMPLRSRSSSETVPLDPAIKSAM